MGGTSKVTFFSCNYCGTVHEGSHPCVKKEFDKKLAQAMASDTKQIGSGEPMRKFESGATRDTNTNKLEWRRFLSLPALKRYCEYMHQHRKQADGTLREPDNWKKGIPLDVYADSLYRHMQEWALLLEREDGEVVGEEVEELLCAILFNAFGYLHELVKK